MHGTALTGRPGAVRIGPSGGPCCRRRHPLRLQPFQELINKGAPNADNVTFWRAVTRQFLRPRVNPNPYGGSNGIFANSDAGGPGRGWVVHARAAGAVLGESSSFAAL